MKRKGLIAVLAAVMVMACSVMSFAGTGELKLLSSYPKDGQKNTSMENVGVKLRFSNDVNKKSVRTANTKYVHLVDEDGKAVPSEVLFSDKDGKLVLVLADTTKYTVKNNSEYTVKIDPSFADNDGNTLGSETKITFKTYNQRMNNFVNMAMMVIMFGGIMVVTMKQQKEKEAENNGNNKQQNHEAAFNPYKEAKRTGKTVQEVIEEENKRQEKLAKKNKKKGISTPSNKKEKIICADYLTNVYHVHAPAPIHKKRKGSN